MSWTRCAAMAGVLSLVGVLADAQTQCRFYLANHSDATNGLAVSLEGTEEGGTRLKLSQRRLGVLFVEKHCILAGVTPTHG
jgi:hypothetical protein